MNFKEARTRGNQNLSLFYLYKMGDDMNSSLKIFDSIISDLETQIYHLENQI